MTPPWMEAFQEQILQTPRMEDKGQKVSVFWPRLEIQLVYNTRSTYLSATMDSHTIFCGEFLPKPSGDIVQDLRQSFGVKGIEAAQNFQTVLQALVIEQEFDDQMVCNVQTHSVKFFIGKRAKTIRLKHAWAFFERGFHLERTLKNDHLLASHGQLRVQTPTTLHARLNILAQKPHLLQALQGF